MFIHLNDLYRVAIPVALAAAVTTQTPTCTLEQQQLLQQQAEQLQNARNAEAANTSSSSAPEVLSPARALTQWIHCPELLKTAPRGLACLQCLQPEAETQAEAVVQMLLESCIEKVAINYLVDGSFSFDENTLRNHIEALTTGGRKLSLLLYLTNGPTQRKYLKPLLNGFATNISPSDFRKLILTDSSIIDGFRQIVKRVVPIIEYADSRGADVLVVPMLEDNLDAESFAAMADIVKQVIPSTLAYRLGRNPCPGCSWGADNSIPAGMFRETHNVRSLGNVHDGVATNDGEWCAIEAEHQKGTPKLSLDDINRARDQAAQNNDVFLLWSASRQGLYYNNSGDAPRHSAAKREYALPTDTERQQTIWFLRGNN